MDYAKELLGLDTGKREDKTKSKIDYAAEFFSAQQPVPQPKVVGDYEETGAISTITGEPVKEFVGDPETQAGFLTLMKTGFVDDPQTKMKIFAAARFPDLPHKERVKRYAVIDNDIVFKGDDGNYHREVDEDLLSKLWAFGAKAPAHLPSALMGGLGATAGPGPAAMGAAGGEGIRKTVGALAFDEPQTTKENIKDMAIEGAVGGIAEVFSKALVGGVNAAKMRKGGALKYSAGEDIKRGGITPELQAKAEEIMTLAKGTGIDLAPHQAYDSEYMTNAWKMLRKHPKTSNAVRDFEDLQRGQVENAMEGYIGKTAGHDDVYTTGQQLVDESKGIIKDAHKTRSKAVKPMYKKAVTEGTDVDISGAINEIDTLIEKSPPNIPARKTLEKVKSFFLDEKDNPLTDIEKIDWAKKEADKYLKNIQDPNIQSTSKATLQKIREIKDTILEAVDEVSPEYKKARDTYGKLTPGVTKIEQSAIGYIAKLKNDKQIKKAANELLSQTNTTWRSVLKYRNYIKRKNPDLWDRAIGAYIKDTYESLKVTEGGKIANVAGKMYKQLFGTQKQRDIWMAAMSPKQLRGFEDIMKVFRSVAIGQEKESMTMPLQAIEKEMGSKLYNLARETKGTAADWVLGKWNDVLVKGRQEDLFKALTSDKVISQIGKMKTLKPGTEKWVKGLTVFTVLMMKEVEYQ